MLGLISALLPFGRLALEAGLSLVDKKVSNEIEREKLHAEVVRRHMELRSDVMLRGAYIIWFWFAAPLAFYWAWILIVDKVLGLGTTDPLEGQIGDWADIIIGAVFIVPLGGSALTRWRK